ncbi:MAG: DNA-binding protein HU-beta [candidate division WWE3 bacterium GW2011_GWA2_43_24]|nr:MAG: DNA-binding protein HU-beta [candidate division WWE3 bacterium GW2011_GWA2_43_24]
MTKQELQAKVADRAGMTKVDAAKGNPQTGAPLHIPASKTPAFKAGKGLKDAVK